MTDGWNWQQPGGGRPSGQQVPGAMPVSPVPSYNPPPSSSRPPHPADPAGPGSPWWSDALGDPWRDPHAPAAVVVQPGVAGGAEPEPVADPDAPRPPGNRSVLLVAVVSALLAGLLGGSLGYAFAARSGVGGARTTLGGNGASPPAAANRPPDSLAGVAARLLPSVVTVRVASSDGSSLGSGFVVSADGYVITNDHVVEGGGTQTFTAVFSDGSTASAKLVGQDPESDIAVIKLARAGLTPVEFGDSDAIAVGDPVLAIGSPLALANTVTAGIVSAVDRTIQAGDPGGPIRYYAAIQTDAAVNQGNSGGPLVDAGGRVVGVNAVIKSVSADEQSAGNIGLAFAIPINQAKRVAQDIIDTGKARRTVIGAKVTNGRTTGAGVRLDTVEPGGPAESAGLRAGDVVTRIDRHPLEEATDLIALVRKYAPGAVVTVEYRRGSETQTASVTLAADAQ
ncbi:trypsin-like peptidase domain-containing protein [Asanoa sp. WMMD1127]|uniref:S1C family serine protease n=1 Tax=Asanoa sp. WMMD1127 TaxID=3016107 RepID=UPI002415A60B|nr:trypsin-like peptidase domain-containing protein [Asanoa sp. WMMD1127]MDG4822640.1 trypsin-like peptidase domain-containing protein [Asanoa sp. WMMD1127]